MPSAAFSRCSSLLHGLTGTCTAFNNTKSPRQGSACSPAGITNLFKACARCGELPSGWDPGPISASAQQEEPTQTETPWSSPCVYSALCFTCQCFESLGSAATCRPRTVPINLGLKCVLGTYAGYTSKPICSCSTQEDMFPPVATNPGRRGPYIMAS